MQPVAQGGEPAAATAVRVQATKARAAQVPDLCDVRENQRMSMPAS